MKNLILQLFLCLCITVFSQQAKQIDLLIAGELSKTLTAEDKKTLQHLTLTGSIDARDIKCLRDELVLLQRLDIRNTTIEKYEGKNGTLPFNEYTVYQANQLPPYSFNNYAVGKATLKHIYLPNSITKIGQNAFKQCKTLAEITIPNSVNVIGESAFSDCTSLRQLTYPALLTRIECNAFSNCEQITNIKLPDNLQYIGKSAFQDCCKLFNLTIGRSPITICESAFAFCSELKTLFLHCKEPPNIALNAFDLANIETVYVQADSLKKYLKNLFWSKYNVLTL